MGGIENRVDKKLDLAQEQYVLLLARYFSLRIPPLPRREIDKIYADLLPVLSEGPDKIAVNISSLSRELDEIYAELRPLPLGSWAKMGRLKGRRNEVLARILILQRETQIRELTREITWDEYIARYFGLKYASYASDRRIIPHVRVKEE